MIGIRTIRSLLRRVSLPDGVRDEREFLEVWLSPYLPRWDFKPDVRDGPYRLIHSGLGDYGDLVHGFEVNVDLVALVASMARHHMPAVDEVTVILDQRCQIVLGWRHDPTGPQIGGFTWGGCSYAFDLLAAYYPQEDVALWEAAARDARKVAFDGFPVEVHHDR